MFPFLLSLLFRVRRLDAAEAALRLNGVNSLPSVSLDHAPWLSVPDPSILSTTNIGLLAYGSISCTGVQITPFAVNLVMCIARSVIALMLLYRSGARPLVTAL